MKHCELVVRESFSYVFCQWFVGLFFRFNNILGIQVQECKCSSLYKTSSCENTLTWNSNFKQDCLKCQAICYGYDEGNQFRKTLLFLVASKQETANQNIQLSLRSYIILDSMQRIWLETLSGKTSFFDNKFDGWLAF